MYSNMQETAKRVGLHRLLQTALPHLLFPSQTILLLVYVSVSSSSQ